MSSQHGGADSKDVPGPSSASASASRPYRDLCSTCNHAEACGHRSTPDRPIFYCENFDAFVPIAPRPPRATTVDSRSAGVLSAGRRQGLCVNCENRDTCTMPKPEGGVWHCEEYR